MVWDPRRSGLFFLLLFLLLGGLVYDTELY